MNCEGPDDLEESAHILEFRIWELQFELGQTCFEIKIDLVMCTYYNDAIAERMAVAPFHNEHLVIISSNKKIAMPHWRKYLEQNWEEVTCSAFL